MRPHARLEREVLCPFFKSFGDRRLACEGYFDDLVALHLFFRDNKAMDLHISTFCDNHFKNCEIHHLILVTKFGADD